MAPDSTERLIAVFAAAALSSPASFALFDAAYACAVHPLDASSPGVHLLPRQRRATMLLTEPINVREQRQERVNISEDNVLDSDLSIGVDDNMELHPGTSNVALALACVARQEEIYSVMSSALMQRRVFGIMGPLLGLALEPLSWIVRVVFGWISKGNEPDDFYQKWMQGVTDG
ncbi:hypothetical protein EV121DRAFT_289836 [Schizophyllum commune]